VITKINLNHFRCFENFTLDNLCPITLIAGANNVGKSTILESIYLFMMRYSGDIFSMFNSLRGLKVNGGFTPQTTWEPLFANMDPGLLMEINLTFDDITKEHKLSFTKGSKAYELFTFDFDRFPDIQTLRSENYALNVSYYEQVSHERYTFVIKDGKVVLLNPEPLNHLIIYTEYFSSHDIYSSSSAAELYGQLVMKGRADQCIKIMNSIDSRINQLMTIPFGSASSIFADIGLDVPLPVNMLGDGINKLLQIILSMLLHPGGIILIDEIENGFHYSFYPKLWNILGTLAHETNCQIIATTHSHECISGAAEIATASPNLFRYVRLERNESTILPKIFDNDSYIYAIEHDWEVR
jgi:predicted ATP-dependent endonuclease of OLD family